MTKENVSDWLQASDRSRDWLAVECGVSKRTVDNWLSSAISLPSKAVLIIERLMEADRAKAAELAEVPQNLVLEFTKSQFDSICDAALSEQKKPRDWAEGKLLELADLDLQEVAREIKSGVVDYDFQKKAGGEFWEEDISEIIK